MKSLRNSLTAALSAGLLVAGAALLFPVTGPQVLSTAASQQVSGGTINGVKFTYANCPAASIPCTAGLCNQTTHQCPANTAERYQVAPTYPFGTAAGSDWETTVPANYICQQERFCSNPCSQSTQAPNFFWYCGGAVGPISNRPPVAGVQGGVPFSPEA